MNIIISANSSMPIYEQITSQMKEMIISNKLKAGDNLPSVRGLAKSLHISIMTVQRAYDDLQKDCFVTTTAGKGTYVANINNNLKKEENQKNLENKVMEIVRIAKLNNISINELNKLISLIYEGEY